MHVHAAIELSREFNILKGPGSIPVVTLVVA